MNDGRKKWEISKNHQIKINLNFFDKIIQGQKI